MVLSRNAIISRIERRVLTIDPEPKIFEAHVEIHFGYRFAKTQDTLFESSGRNSKWELEPGAFILAQAEEYLELPDDLSGLYDTDKFLAQSGVMTHLGNRFVEPSYRGSLILHVFNLSQETIILQDGMRAGQIVFLTVEP